MTTRLIKISCAIALAVVLAGCGGGGGDSDGASSPPPGSNAPPPSATTGIGAAGGTVTGPSGSQVVVPAGALTTSTNIAVAQSNAGAPPLPSGVTPFGEIFAFTPHGTAFATPVTITVPFDPSKVPAGTTPVLYKTNAAQSAWEVVSGATVTGSTMVGSVSGFSFGVVASLNPAQKRWQADSYTVSGRRENIAKDSGSGTGKVDVADVLGPPLFITPPGIAADIPAYTIHSNESGRTFWTQAVAPNETGDPSRIGARSTLTQTFYFQVNPGSSPPQLSFVITQVSLETVDQGGHAPNIFVCPWLPLNPTPQQLTDSCVSHMSEAEATFRVQANSFADHGRFFATGGAVEVTGIHGDWRPLVTGDITDHAVWHDGDFTFLDDVDDDQGRHFAGFMKLPKKTVEIPVSHLHAGDIFSVQVDMTTTAINHIQGESFVAAFIRDPLQEAGLELQTTGLTEIPPRDDIPTTLPPLTCASGADPSAGELQFSRATFSAPESEDGASIIVERTGGTTGAVGVRIETHDGSAQAGSDYETVSTEVRFADGEDGQRRIALAPVNDDVAEDDETLDLVLSNVGGCAQLGTRTSATLTILDDDRPVPVTPTFTLSGTVTGLAGGGLILSTNRFDQVQPVANGAFSFPRQVNDGDSYTVTITTQPVNPTQICTVSNGSGIVAGADITNILVNCATSQANGTLDASFGSQGKVSSNTIGTARKIALQADGKLLALGSLILSRFNADGSVDTTFGSGGTVHIATLGNGLDSMAALAVQPDGKIVVVGHTSLPTVLNDDFITLRFNTDGSPDMSFGTGGRVLTEFDGFNDQAKSVVIQANGKIVVAGQAQLGATFASADQDFAVVRYLSDGTPDPGFGTAGKATLSSGGRSDFVNAAALQADGSIVVVGRVFKDGGSGNSDVGVARFLSSGIFDPAFGTNGFERIDFDEGGIVPATFDGGEWDEANDVAIQSDGKILVVGYTITSGVFHAAMLRLSSAAGALDLGFSGTGLSRSTALDKANRIVLQSDGQFVIVGNSGSDFGIARFSSAGAPDTTFGSVGLVTADFFGNTDEALDVLVQPDGKIVAAGSARNGASRFIGMVRVLP
jgi:uncharacterized delta-60 repeat protein